MILGANFTDQEIESARIGNKLQTNTLLLSNKCNLNCIYCYRNAGIPLRNELSLEDRKEIIQQAKKLGARMLWIPGSGEPFCDKTFFNRGEFPLIDFANDLGLKVVFFTNGTAITEQIAKKLFDKEVSIITKLNSFNSPIQDFLSGRTGSYELIQGGLKNLIYAGFNKSYPSRLGIDSVIVKQNYKEIVKLFRYCRDENIIPYITTQLHGGRGIDNATLLDVPFDKIRKLFLELLAIDRKRYGFSWHPCPPIVAGSCRRLLYDLVVGPDGNIQICPGIKISLGNSRNDALKKILDSSSLIHKMRNPKKYLEGKCKKCQNSKCLYGCRLSAYAAGNLFGEDPQCWN